MSSSISDANATKINKMNKAFQNITGGTLMQGFEDDIDALEAQQVVASGSMLVYALHTNASVVTIATGLGSIVGFNLQAFKSGSATGEAYYVDSASGSLKVMAISGCSVLEDGLKMNWIAW